MTPAALRAELSRQGLTQTALARETGMSVRAVQHWCLGRGAVPPWVASWLAMRERLSRL